MENKFKFEKAAPEAVGVKSQDLMEFIVGLHENDFEPHSMLVYKDGRLALEASFSPYDISNKHEIYSISKSFISIALAIALDEELINLGDSIISFFPEYLTVNISDNLANMQIQHLLDMRSGHGICTFDAFVKEKFEDRLKGFFTIPVKSAPGSVYCYDAGLSYVLGAIIEKVSGMKLVDYLEPRLFEPLHIENPVWEECDSGRALAGMGLNITLYDVLRFGIMLMQGGEFEGKRIVTEHWLLEITSYADSEDSRSHYHNHFLVDSKGMYHAAGAFGQLCFIVPEQKLVIAVNSGTRNLSGLTEYIKKKLIPLFGDESLAENEESHSALIEYVKNYRVSPEKSKQSGFRPPDEVLQFKLQKNDLHFSEAIIEAEDNDLVMTIAGGCGVQTIKFGYEKWISQEQPLFCRRHMKESEKTAAAFSMIDKNTIAAEMRFPEMAYIINIQIKYDAKNIQLFVKPNLPVGRLGLWLNMPEEGVTLLGERQRN